MKKYFWLLRRKVTVKSWALRFLGVLFRTDEVVFIDVPGFSDLYMDFGSLFKKKYFLHNKSLGLKDEFRIARAKVLVSACGAAKLEVNRSAFRIELWHASGAIKAIRNFSYKGLPNKYVVVSPSLETAQYYQTAFGAKPGMVEALGLPRTDDFFNKETVEIKQKDFLFRYPQLVGKKIYLFAPTFRGDPRGAPHYRGSLDIRALVDHLQKDEAFLVKMHPLVDASEYVGIRSRSGGTVMNVSDEHIRSLLMVSDVLISDYSSIIFDAVLLKKPILVYAEDIDRYKLDPGFGLDYRAELPVPILEGGSAAGILEAVRKLEVDLGKYEKFISRYLGACDGGSRNRILDRISIILGKSFSLSMSARIDGDS